VLLGDVLCIAELTVIAVVAVIVWTTLFVSPARADSLRRCISDTVCACGDREGKE